MISLAFDSSARDRDLMIHLVGRAVNGTFMTLPLRIDDDLEARCGGLPRHRAGGVQRGERRGTPPPASAVSVADHVLHRPNTVSSLLRR
jgi:hypothetical protein